MGDAERYEGYFLIAYAVEWTECGCCCNVENIENEITPLQIVSIRQYFNNEQKAGTEKSVDKDIVLLVIYISPPSPLRGDFMK